MNKIINSLLRELGIEPEELFEIKGCEGTVYYFDDKGTLRNAKGEETINPNLLFALIYKQVKIAKVYHGPFKPRVGQMYFYINQNNMVVSSVFTEDDKYMLDLIAYNDVFPTQQEASDYLWFTRILRALSGAYSIQDDCLYFLSYDKYTDTLLKGYTKPNVIHAGAYYFTEKNLNKFFQAVGMNRIKKYLFHVYN